MPDYFADYDTAVHFISQKELQSSHSALRTAALSSATAELHPMLAGCRTVTA
jgi:hypothetical protein